MGPCPIARVTRVLQGIREALHHHASNCGDHVVGIALHPSDHDDLSIAELWGLPVLAWDEVPAGDLRLLCDASGVLIPELHTFEELLEHWTYRSAPSRATT